MGFSIIIQHTPEKGKKGMKEMPDMADEEIENKPPLKAGKKDGPELAPFHSKIGPKMKGKKFGGFKSFVKKGKK